MCVNTNAKFFEFNYFHVQTTVPRSPAPILELLIMSSSLFWSNVHAEHRIVVQRHIAPVVGVQLSRCINNGLISFQLRIRNLIVVVVRLAIVSFHCMHSRSIVAVIDAAKSSRNNKTISASSIFGAKNYEFKFAAQKCERKLWQLTARAMLMQHVEVPMHQVRVNGVCVCVCVLCSARMQTQKLRTRKNNAVRGWRAYACLSSAWDIAHSAANCIHCIHSNLRSARAAVAKCTKHIISNHNHNKPQLTVTRPLELT